LSAPSIPSSARPAAICGVVFCMLAPRLASFRPPCALGVYAPAPQLVVPEPEAALPSPEPADSAVPCSPVVGASCVPEPPFGSDVPEPVEPLFAEPLSPDSPAAALPAARASDPRGQARLPSAGDRAPVLRPGITE